MKEPIVSLQNVTYHYRHGEEVSRGVLHVDLAVHEGEFLVVLGHNGSGKSTLAKLMNGFLLPEEGTVTVNGIVTANEDQIFEIRSQVGMVFQNPDNQMVASIIEDDLAFGPENLGLPREEIRKRVDWALQVVNMTEHKDRTPNKLSGGQKQRIAIAAVLAMTPKVLILDESTAMLDPKGRAEVLKTAHELNKHENMSIVLITHYMDEAVDADRVVVMNGGEIVANGTPNEVFAQHELLEASGLELPIASQVSLALQKKGYPIPLCLTDEALAEAVCLLK